MSTTTTRLSLTKPTEATDLVDIDQINANMDLLDATAAFNYVTTTTRPSTTVFAGRAAYETDTGLIVLSNGSAPASASWLYPGSVAQNKTNATRPTVVVAGELVRESDTGNLLVHNGSSPASGGWEQLRSNVRVFTSGTRPSSPTTFAGLAIRESDTHNLLIHNGSTPASAGWEHVSIPVVSATANIVAPYTDQMVMQSSDHTLYRYNGSSWVATLGSSSPLGYIASTVNESSDVSTSSTTETVMDYVNFTAVAGRRYALEYYATVAAGTVGDAFQVRFRWQATSGALTAGGTAFHYHFLNPMRDTTPVFFKSKTLTGLTGGTQYAIGMTIQRTGGTGVYTLKGGATANSRVMALYDVGV